MDQKGIKFIRTKADRTLKVLEDQFDRYIESESLDHAASTQTNYFGVLFTLQMLELMNPDEAQARRAAMFERYMAARFPEV